MNPDHPVLAPRCAWSDEVLAQLLGDAGAHAREEVDAHVAGCAACAQLRADFAHVSSELRSLPPAPAPDLADIVVARTMRAGRFSRWIPLAAAASLFIAVGLWRAAPHGLQLGAAEPEAAAEVRVDPVRPSPASPAGGAVDADSAVARAVAWLISTQESQGSWSAAAWGAQSNYTAGVTALAMLAVLSDPQHAATKDAAAVCDRGAAYLLGQQRPDGLIGPAVTGSLYNHALACLALAEAESRRAGRVDREALRRALAVIAAAQHADGGWTYLRAPGGRANSSITVWAVLALARAEELGLRAADDVVPRGLAWIESTISEEGRTGYRAPGDHPRGPESMTAAAAVCLLDQPGRDRERLGRMLQRVRDDVARADGAPDFYRTFFQAAALRAAGLGESPEVAQLETQLQQLQERDGQAVGSWAATDQWARAGGRVYATAMAVLALREN